MAVFFDECELKGTVQYEYEESRGRPSIYVCRKPKLTADAIWSSMKTYR